MINVKDIVYKGLSQVVENVSDAYPLNWSKTPAILYVEEENKPYEFTDDKEQLSFVRFRIEIWDMKSTSQTACDVDDIMSSLGFLRTTCADGPDPSGLKHKQMRYEAIIDCKKQFIYHTK